MEKIFKPITIIGKTIRNLFEKLPFIRKFKNRGTRVDQSVLMFLIGIVIVITVGFMGWVYSYMYSVQKAYDDAQPKIIYQQN